MLNFWENLRLAVLIEVVLIKKKRVVQLYVDKVTSQLHLSSSVGIVCSHFQMRYVLVKLVLNFS